MTTADSSDAILSTPWAPFQESPNHSDRRGHDVDLCVIHYTAAGSGGLTARWLRAAESKASYHLIGYRDGSGCQLVPLDRAAWHAGRAEYFDSDGRRMVNVNRRSIGIALANHGLLEQIGNRFFYRIGTSAYPYKGPQPVYATHWLRDGATISGHWEPYTQAQLDWLELAIKYLRIIGYRFQLAGHDEVALPVGRKLDPGCLLPWARFREQVEVIP